MNIQNGLTWLTTLSCTCVCLTYSKASLFMLICIKMYSTMFSSIPRRNLSHHSSSKWNFHFLFPFSYTTIFFLAIFSHLLNISLFSRCNHLWLCCFLPSMTVAFLKKPIKWHIGSLGWAGISNKCQLSSVFVIFLDFSFIIFVNPDHLSSTRNHLYITDNGCMSSHFIATTSAWMFPSVIYYTQH